MSKIMTAEEWIKKFHPNTETFNVARLELELKAYAQYYHSQMTAPQDVEKAIEEEAIEATGLYSVKSQQEEAIKWFIEGGKFGYSLRQEKDAVEFAEWIRVNSYEWYETHKAWCNNPNDWENGGEPTYLTTADLYRQFKSK